MTPPLKVQLAIQGGGAKISALLAATEALQELSNDGQLKVTRVAGTSAGAIAACLLAGEIPIWEVKAYLQGGIGTELADYFPSPTWWNFYRTGVHGKAFWRTDLLQKYLGKLFATHKLFDIADLEKKSGMEVLIVAADLRDSRKVTAEKDKSIVSALMDSCGLPFCFRTWPNSDGPVIVDGGLCENLPIGELQKDEEDGPIVAISFKRTLTTTPKSLTQFSMALLNTAINNSMYRARSGLTQDCILEIDTVIGTFDFRKAVTDGLGAEYKLVHKQTKDFFEEFTTARTKKKTAVIGDPWTEKNPRAIESMRGLWKVYSAQHARNTFKYWDCLVEVTAHSLRPDPDSRQPDQMIYSSVFQPIDVPIQCMSVALMSSAEGFLGKTKWTLRDEQDNEITSIALPAINENSPLDRELIHFFDPVLQPKHGKFRVVFKDDAYDLFAPFIKTGKDELVFYPRRARGKIDRIRIVLHIPKGSSAVMAAKAPDGLGRAMTKKELVEFEDRRPIGFDLTIGWIGENIENTTFGPDLRM
jgi:predicted acylesterase/phospholipase RssA